MSIPNLPVNFKDDILAASNPKRKYQQTFNSDGSVSLEDVTVYSQTGSEFGASQVNQTNKAINNIYSERILDLDELELVTEPGFFVDALAVAELNSNLTPQILQISVNSENVDTSFGYIVAAKCGNVIVVSGTVRVKKAVGVYGGMNLASGLPIPIGAKTIYGSAISKDGAYASCIFEIRYDGTLNLDVRAHSVSSGDTFLGQIVYLCQ